MHIFRISTELCHLVTQVEGTVIKIAFAGWFFDQAGEVTFKPNENDW